MPALILHKHLQPKNYHFSILLIPNPQLKHSPLLHSSAFFLFLFLSLSFCPCLLSFFFIPPTLSPLLISSFASASSLMATDYFVCMSFLSAVPHLLPPSSVSYSNLYTSQIHASMCNRAYRVCIHPSDLWSFIYTEHEKWLTVCVCVCACVCGWVRQSGQHWPSRLWRGCIPIGIPDVEANYCLCHLDSPCSRWAQGCTGNT